MGCAAARCSVLRLPRAIRVVPNVKLRIDNPNLRINNPYGFSKNLGIDNL